MPRWSGSDDVFAFFHDCPIRERRKLLEWINRIANFPANSCSDQERDNKGRLYSVAFSGKWRVAYWVDPDGGEVRVVDVRVIK